MRKIRCLLGFHDEEWAVALPDDDEQELRRISRRDPEYFDHLLKTAPPVGVVACRDCGRTKIGPL